MSKKPNLLAPYINEIKDNVFDEFNISKKRRRKKRNRIIKLVSLFLVFLAIILAINLAIFYADIKGIYTSSIDAKNNLEQSVYFAKQKDFEQAGMYSRQAEQHFNISLARLERVKNMPIGWLPGIRGKIKDAIYLTETGRILSSAINKGSAIGKIFFSIWDSNDKLVFSDLSLDDKKIVLDNIYQNRKTLIQVNDELTLAIDNLNNIKNKDLFLANGIDVDQLADEVLYMKEISEVAVPIFETLPYFAGYPKQSNYLFIFQNKDELRPTGGFIGTYGVSEVENGDIKNIQTDDIYHLDMPAVSKLKVDPPKAFKDYLGVNYWYMRDANWSPDWPTSAQKIEWFYQRENALLNKPNSINNFDFVIAITSDFITDLLAITGPVKVNGQIYNENNFVPLLQDTTGKDFYSMNVSRWNRKQIIGDITKEIKIKLFDNIDEYWIDLVRTMQNNLNEKNILVYSKHEEVNKVFKENNWDGSLKTTTQDYIMVVDANMAALKTDAVMNKSLDYRVSQTKDGLISKLRINYANTGKFSWKTTRYRSYTRIYIPLGSKLVRATGFTEGEVEIGEENGKTYFGLFISVEPKEFGSLYLEYKLPKVIQNSNYNLVLQRQPGSVVDNFNIDLSFTNGIKSYNPTGFHTNQINKGRIKFEGKLNSDKEYNINF